MGAGTGEAADAGGAVHESIVIARNALLELPRLSGTIQKAHFLAVALSHFYGVPPDQVEVFSRELSADSPVVAALASLAGLDLVEHRSIVTLALRALYFVLLDSGAAMAFSQAYEYMVPRLVQLSGLAKSEDVIGAFTAERDGQAEGAAALSRMLRGEGKYADSDDGAFLAGTFIPDDVAMPFDKESGCDQIADAASSLLAHLALHSVTTRKQLCVDRNLNELLGALSRVSLGEVLTPYRLINVINVFLFLLSLTSASEMTNLLVDLVYRRNFKGIVIELGNSIFLNNPRWHALYSSQSQAGVRVRTTNCGVYMLGSRRPIFESQDLYLLKQQLIRLIKFCMLIV